jgi:lipid II:glycine glycyltransferase (peptidoglycan interpeptide bridge formation enzyme)
MRSGGFLARHPVEPETLRVVLDDIRAVRPFRTFLRPNPRHASLWAAAVPEAYASHPRKAHILELSGGFSAVWSKRFNSRTRNKIRKAERSGVAVKCDCSGQLTPIFYDLYLRSVQRWAEQKGEPVQRAVARAVKRNPLEKLTTTAKILGDSCRTWVAWHRGVPAASIIVLQGAHNSQYAKGTMNKAVAAPINANYLLHRVAIEDACNCGSRFYHMGDSGNNDALSHFKARFGAVEVHFCLYSYERFPVSTIINVLRGRGHRKGASTA